MDVQLSHAVELVWAAGQVNSVDLRRYILRIENLAFFVFQIGDAEFPENPYGRTPGSDRYRSPLGHQGRRGALCFAGIAGACRGSIRSSVRAIFLIGEIDDSHAARLRCI